MLYKASSADIEATLAAGREIRAKFYARYPSGSILHESITLGGYRLLGQIKESGFIYFYGTPDWHHDIDDFSEVRDTYKSWFEHALVVSG